VLIFLHSGATRGLIKPAVSRLAYLVFDVDVVSHVEVKLLKKHYTIQLTDNSSGTSRQFAVRLQTALLAAAAIGVTLAAVVIIRNGILTEIQQLRTTNSSLHLENIAYRNITSDLASQADSLQVSIADLSERAALTPNSERAVHRLPKSVKAEALGQTALQSGETWSPMPESVEDTFNVLNNLLQTLRTRLYYVQLDVKRRAALAEATPSIWPTRGWLSAAYGEREDPFTKQPDFHPGIDVSAETGQPIYSTATGVVSSSGWSGDYGKLVELDHGFGIKTRYGHMSQIAIEAGRPVKRGEVIGYVGSTGRTTGAHVHYEILVNNRSMNPRLLLPKRLLAGKPAD
jgi:murein DD-endopeptidase MepM/ murein hydrolase activator NlpD